LEKVEPNSTFRKSGAKPSLKVGVDFAPQRLKLRGSPLDFFKSGGGLKVYLAPPFSKVDMDLAPPFPKVD
jgi:hypothetical protein